MAILFSFLFKDCIKRIIFLILSTEALNMYTQVNFCIFYVLVTIRGKEGDYGHGHAVHLHALDFPCTCQQKANLIKPFAN